MAIDNPAKNFRFSLEINGIEQARCQSIQPPKVELQEHKQGNAGNDPDTKTPGKKTVGDLVLEMVVPGETGDAEIWNAIEAAQNGIRSDYIGQGFLNELGADGVTVVSRFFLKDIWTKIIEANTNYDPREDNASDLMRNVTLSVGDYLRRA